MSVSVLSEMADCDIFSVRRRLTKKGVVYEFENDGCYGKPLRLSRAEFDTLLSELAALRDGPGEDDEE